MQYRPLINRCRTCSKRWSRGCESLNFEAMPKVRQDGLEAIVICTDYAPFKLRDPRKDDPATPELIARLGVESDMAIAMRYKMSRLSVKRLREKAGIAPYKGHLKKI